MELTNKDWGDILDHMRLRVREAGLTDLDDRIFIDFLITNDSRRDFSRYLSALINALTQISNYRHTKTLNIFQDVLGTERAQHVDGIEIIFSDVDSQLFGAKQFDLANAENLAPLIRELELLGGYLMSKGLLYG